MCVKDRADARREAADEVFVLPPKRQRVHPFCFRSVKLSRMCRTSQNKSAVSVRAEGTPAAHRTVQSFIFFPHKLLVAFLYRLFTCGGE